jgi:phosphate transport system substrate-binding protein
MVTLNKAIQDKFPTGSVILQANGTNKGLQSLAAGKVDVAAVSRELTSEEEAQGLVATKVGDDAIAFVVGVNSKVGDLTFDGLKAIFSGRSKFKVYNRPEGSATREMVSKAFGLSTLAGKTLPRDNTTQMLGLLKDDGIGLQPIAR